MCPHGGGHTQVARAGLTEKGERDTDGEGAGPGWGIGGWRSLWPPLAGGGDFQHLPLGLSFSVCKITPVLFRNLWIRLRTPGARGALASREWRVGW